MYSECLFYGWLAATDPVRICTPRTHPGLSEVPQAFIRALQAIRGPAENQSAEQGVPLQRALPASSMADSHVELCQVGRSDNGESRRRVVMVEADRLSGNTRGQKLKNVATDAYLGDGDPWSLI